MHGLVRRLFRGILILLLMQKILSLSVQANGGQVRIAEYPVGAYVVTVFTSPVPLQTGQIDVSVLLQKRETKEIVQDAEIFLFVEPTTGGATTQYRVTREQATNPLYYASEFTLNQPGAYRMRLEIRGPEGAGAVEFVAQVEEAANTLWQSWWVWGTVALVAGGILWWIFQRGSPVPASAKRPKKS